MITYEINDALYINLTNGCTNNCCFCVRNHLEGFGFDLWLDKEPSLPEIISKLSKRFRNDAGLTGFKFQISRKCNLDFH